MDLIWFVCAGGFAFEQNINYQSFLSSHLAVYNCLLIYFYLLVIRGGGSTGAAGVFAPINFQQRVHCTRPD